jgi:hypothetical protein
VCKIDDKKVSVELPESDKSEAGEGDDVGRYFLGKV